MRKLIQTVVLLNSHGSALGSSGAISRNKEKWLSLSGSKGESLPHLDTEMQIVMTLETLPKVIVS